MSPHFDSEDDRVSARRVAALLSKELASAAPDVFNAHAAVLLPLAWLGRHDEDAEVAQAWADAWEEGATSTYVQWSTGVFVVVCDKCILVVTACGAGRRRCGCTCLT